jgi:hypothetical protein
MENQMKFKKMQRNRNLYKKLVKKISFEEKIWLLECEGDYKKYEKKLNFLAKKYSIKT